MSSSTNQIEREVERTRSDLEDTVEAIRGKMSLGQMVDEAANYMRASGGSEMFANLGTQVRANPIPLVLPCHRVIASTGALHGYGLGLWRKEWLLRHEVFLAPELPGLSRGGT